MAVRIGMLPDPPLETYRGIGDTSVLGASMALLDRSLLKEAEQNQVQDHLLGTQR